MSDKPLTTIKLPVWRTVKAAYLVIFQNYRLAIKLGIIPLVFAISPSILNSYFWEVMTMNAELLILLKFFTWIMSIPMITAWHRMVILGHADPDSRIRYSIQKNEWSYLWKAVLFGLIILLTCLLGYLVPTMLGVYTILMGLRGHQETSILITIIIIIKMISVAGLTATIFAFIFRLSLVFPTVAVGKPIGFRESWRNTRNNTWRLFAVVCLGFLPLLVISVVVNGLFFMPWSIAVISIILPTSFGSSLMAVINIPFWLLGLCVGVSVWSWAYRYLVQGHPITLLED